MRAPVNLPFEDKMAPSGQRSRNYCVVAEVDGSLMTGVPSPYRTDCESSLPRICFLRGQREMTVGKSG